MKQLSLSLGILLFTVVVKGQCSISGLGSSYCVNAPLVSLTTAIPGGTLSGPGVLNSSFSPSFAGIGTHTLEYNYCSTAYSVSSIPYTYTSNGLYVIPQLNDNEVSAAVPIGFPFKFFCDTFSNVYFSSNGFITFSPGEPDGCCQGLPLPATTPAPDNMIAICWTDLDPAFGGTIRHDLWGTAPNRIFFAGYNCVFHHNNGSGGDPVTAFVLLYETSNIIEIYLGIKPVPSYSINTTVGIQNNGGTLAYTVPGMNGTSNWSASYQGYRFTPGPTCDITATTSVISAPAVAISWQKYTMCKGETNKLYASGANSYTWSTLQTTNSIVISPTSTAVYTVTGLSGNGCSSSSTVQITVNECTSISENGLTTNELELFPNPGNGYFKINSSIDRDLSVFDCLGKKVKTIEIIGGSSNEIDLSALPAGNYFLFDPFRSEKYRVLLLK